METAAIDRGEYPGRLTTPQINIGPNSFWSQPFDEQQRMRVAAIERALSRRKTWRGAIEHWTRIARYRISRWIYPDA